MDTIVEVKEYITLYVPSGFSPNADGVNDRWCVGHKLLTQFQVKVFNRWGAEVCTAANPDFEWDGRDAQGQLLPEGGYAYVVQALDIHGNLVEKAGTITILR